MSLIDRIADSPTALAFGALAGAGIVALVLTFVLRTVVLRITKRTQYGWDDQVARRMGPPVSALITLHLFRIALEWIVLPTHVDVLLESTIRVLTVLAIIWGFFRAIDVFTHILSQRSWAESRPASRSLLALGGRFAKGAALVLGLLVALSQLGVSVTSLIAGLGLGGLVFALAAQKTVENLFGAVSIGVDQPMREGDYIKVNDVVGTVEAIGLRSTRIRTPDRTVITIPNGALANERIESFTVRDRLRFACTLGLEYSTTPAQMRTVLAALEAILRAQPKLYPDGVTVRFKDLAASSLDIEVVAWFQTTDAVELATIRQDLLLQFMDTVAAAGTGFAFPTRTVHLVQSS